MGITLLRTRYDFWEIVPDLRAQVGRNSVGFPHVGYRPTSPSPQHWVPVLKLQARRLWAPDWPATVNSSTTTTACARSCLCRPISPRRTRRFMANRTDGIFTMVDRAEGSCVSGLLDTDALHRFGEAAAMKEAEAAGFSLITESVIQRPGQDSNSSGSQTSMYVPSPIRRGPCPAHRCVPASRVGTA
jgi:hypothetical protein